MQASKNLRVILERRNYAAPFPFQLGETESVLDDDFCLANEKQDYIT